MWHEARKQERIIRGMIVDYRRRAERRKDFYEKIKSDPTQFLQLHGRPCKIHLDPAIAAAGDSPAIMMPWQGNTSNVIDRFDVRAHLDYIPEIKVADVPLDELSQEERHCNYESYRILAQNQFLGVSENKFLHQLEIEEKFGVTIEEKEALKEKSHEKKGTGAAIGYNYNDPGSQPSCSIGPTNDPNMETKDSDDDSDLEIIDVDLSLDVNKMEAQQAHELNAVGPIYGMAGCDLFSFLTGDADDAEHQKQVLREEKEKAMFSGRKSRRERRAHRDKKLMTRALSPPSYAAVPAQEPTRAASRSVSRTPSPRPPERIQFITSFGGDDDEAKVGEAPSKSLYSDKVKRNLKKEPLYSDVARSAKDRRTPLPEERSAYKMVFGPQRQITRSKSLSTNSRSRSRSYSSRSRSHRSWSRSRSRSRTRHYRRRSRSRSNTNNTSSYGRHNQMRSMASESHSKPVVPRYYGRRKEDKSSSEISYDSDSSAAENTSKNKSGNGGKSNTNQSQLRSGSSAKGRQRDTVSLKEKLKKKMQLQLSRQLRADKRAEAERQERESRRQARRDEEMRELAIKLRRKQREMRHQQTNSSDDSRSRSSSRDSKERSPRKRRSRSRSYSPPSKPAPPEDVDENKDTKKRESDWANTAQEDKFRKSEDRPRYENVRPSRFENARPPRFEDRPPRYEDARPSRFEERPPRHEDFRPSRFDERPPRHEELQPQSQYSHSRERHSDYRPGYEYQAPPQTWEDDSHKRHQFRGDDRGPPRRHPHPGQSNIPRPSTYTSRDYDHYKKGDRTQNKVKLVDY